MGGTSRLALFCTTVNTFTIPHPFPCVSFGSSFPWLARESIHALTSVEERIVVISGSVNSLMCFFSHIDRYSRPVLEGLEYLEALKDLDP